MPSPERSFSGGQRLSQREAGKRPSFSSSITSDRLREGSSIKPVKEPAQGQKRPRRSVFREVGLEDDNIANVTGLSAARQHAEEHEDGKRSAREPVAKKSWLSRGSRPAIKTSASAPPMSFSSLPRVAMLAFLIAVVVPGLRYRGSNDGPLDGVAARATGVKDAEMVGNGMMLEGRADSPLNVCTRWSHQSAVVNGTLYLYGGRSKAKSGQTANTWSKYTLQLRDMIFQYQSSSLTGIQTTTFSPST